MNNVLNDFIANFICFEQWDKNKSYSKYSQRYFFVCRNKKEHEDFMQNYILNNDSFVEKYLTLHYKSYDDLTKEERESSVELGEYGLRSVGIQNN